MNFFRNAGTGSPIGARVRYPAPTERSGAAPMKPSAADASADKWFEIVGVVRDFGVTPDDEGHERPYVFHAVSPGTASPLVMSVRVRGNPTPLAARLPAIAAGVDAGLSVQEAQPLEESIRERDSSMMAQAWGLAAGTALVLLMSAMGIFSLMSVSVSRRTREIGLRATLGANPRRLIADILSRAFVLMGSGITSGGALLLSFVALGGGPTGRSADDLALFAGYLAVTAAVMLTACLVACIEPARRVLGINPIDALKDA